MKSLKKKSTISVMSKMSQKSENTDPQMIVPNNSVTNMISENEGQSSAPIVENSFANLQSSCTNKCPHCENMAKNFLYLESLIRVNYSSRYQCSLCFSALKYLQYVNKGIAQVFGNFDNIVAAARVFGNAAHFGHRMTGGRGRFESKSNIKQMSLKKTQSRPSKVGKKNATRSQHSLGKSVKGVRMYGATQNRKQNRSQINVKKSSHTVARSRSRNTVKGKKLRVLKSKVSVTRGLKRKNSRIQRG